MIQRTPGQTTMPNKRYLPYIGICLGPVLGTLRDMLCTDLPLPEVVAAVVANDLLVTIGPWLSPGNRETTPQQALCVLARISSTIRNPIGGSDGFASIRA
jgi:hypothetical protein